MKNLNNLLRIGAKNSLEKNISEHEAKIKNNPISRGVNHWQKEIKTWKEQLQILKDEILNGGY